MPEYNIPVDFSVQTYVTVEGENLEEAYYKLHDARYEDDYVPDELCMMVGGEERVWTRMEKLNIDEDTLYDLYPEEYEKYFQ